MCYVGPDEPLLRAAEPVNKCFVIYLLFRCDVSGQHCTVSKHLNCWTLYYTELYRD